MPAEYDPSDFVDSDFESSRKAGHSSGGLPTALERAPTRDEVESKVTETQTRLAELKRAQEELERERASLEELKRRQAELQTGREEIVHQVTRGVGLLEEAEFAARRDVEQMAKSLLELREALLKVQGINQEQWTRDNYSVELTRALTTLENARMEWNSARLKFPILSNNPANPEPPVSAPVSHPIFSQQSIGELCKLGLALTWPLVLLGLAIFLMLFLRR